MAAEDTKIFMIKEYFNDIEKRVAFLDELVSSNHADEALLLCSVYIESLANRYYKKYGSSKGFCLALMHLTKNELFSFIHPRQLLNKLESNKVFEENIDKIKSVLEGLDNELNTFDSIKNQLSGTLTKQQEKWLEKYSFKGSMAMIVYERIRCEAVHDIYTPKLTFSASKLNGQSVPDIDFDLLKSSLVEIVSNLKEKSLKERNLFLQHPA